jgi:hypothetical protein
MVGRRHVECVARSHLLMSMCAAISANQVGGGEGGGGEGGKWGGGGGEGRSSGLRKKGGVWELRRERHLVRSSWQNQRHLVHSS